MLITKVKPGIYMSGWMVVWAAVSGMDLPASSRIELRSLTCSSFDRSRAKLRRTSGLPILPRYHGGASKHPILLPYLGVGIHECDADTIPLVLSRRDLHLVHLLYAARYVTIDNGKKPLLYILTSLKKEVAARIALLYCAQILATGFSGLIAAGVFEGMDGVRGLAGWRW